VENPGLAANFWLTIKHCDVVNRRRIAIRRYRIALAAALFCMAFRWCWILLFLNPSLNLQR
jgi:hypothetical protein